MNDPLSKNLNGDPMFDCLLLLAVRTAAIAATPNCKTALKLSMLTHESIAQIGQKLKVMDCCNPD